MYHGQYNRGLYVDEYIHKTYFTDIKSGFFIEAGAFDGVVESSCLYFEENAGWKGINIEPSRHYKNLCLKRPNSINIKAALSDEAGFTTFCEVEPNHLGWGHIESANRETGYKETKVRVPSITFPMLVDMYDIEEIDLMVLDIEGAELSVLSTFKDSRIVPKVLCVEHSFVGIEEIKRCLGDLYRYDSQHFVNAYFIRNT